MGGYCRWSSWSSCLPLVLSPFTTSLAGQPGSLLKPCTPHDASGSFSSASHTCTGCSAGPAQLDVTLCSVSLQLCCLLTIPREVSHLSLPCSQHPLSYPSGSTTPSSGAPLWPGKTRHTSSWPLLLHGALTREQKQQVSPSPPPSVQDLMAIYSSPLSWDDLHPAPSLRPQWAGSRQTATALPTSCQSIMEHLPILSRLQLLFQTFPSALQNKGSLFDSHHLPEKAIMVRNDSSFSYTVMITYRSDDCHNDDSFGPPWKRGKIQTMQLRNTARVTL